MSKIKYGEILIMEAYKCDRCNRLYTEQERAQIITLENNPFYIVRKAAVPDAYSYDLDLCPDCSAALKIFIELKGIPT